MSLHNLDAIHGDEHDQLPMMDVCEIDMRIDDFFSGRPANAGEILAEKGMESKDFQQQLLDFAALDLSSKTLSSTAALLEAAKGLHKLTNELVAELVENEEF